MDATAVIIEPIITEKAVMMKETGEYVFRVNPKANKIDIRQAVEKLFKVKVAAVNTVNLHKGGKKAYVRLVSGKIEELEV
ncbi:MAG: 50S ribosomal protein L23 [Candidatus Margulisiibacteriota bacterium]